jgi:outer membrane phospholipase A
MLKEAGLKDWGSRWYVYIGENDTFDTVFQRMKFLKENNQGCYVMRDSKIKHKPEYIALASWGNMMGAFKQDFKDLLKKSKRLRTYAKYFKGYDISLVGYNEKEELENEPIKM